MKHYKKKHLFFTAASIMLIGVVFFGFRFFEGDYFFKINKSIELYGRVYKEIAINYVDELDPEKFMHSGIDGMLDGLDPYTNFYEEKEGDQIELITSGKYAGVGISISFRDEKVIITSLMDGYSAQRQGLQPGDCILEVDGKPVSGMKGDQVRMLTRGEPGTEVHMKIEREDEKEPLNFVLVREEIRLKNVTYADYIDTGIGYIKLERFSRSAGDEFRIALKDLKLKGTLKGLIIDLRDNPGGLLEAATDIVEKFVPNKSVIVTTRGRKAETERKYASEEEPMIPDIPLVVLVNKGSASASEIVAGALQDLDRAVIVGTRSFGKGLVQTIVPLAYGAQLKMTTAKYYTPSGRCIQEIDYMHKDKVGMFNITPDSLRQKFKTKNGRVVSELGGILPDTVVPDMEQTALFRELVRRSVFFRFANRFVSGRKDSTLPGNNELIKQFSTFLDSTHFIYKNDAEKKLAELDTIAINSKYSKALRDEIGLMEKKIAEEKKDDLSKNRNQILRSLRREIMSRYKGETGRIAASLIDDDQIKVAEEVLGNNRQYKQILATADEENR